MTNARIAIRSVMTCIALLAMAGCGAVQEETGPTSEAEIGTAEGALIIYPCGMGCPSGYYPTATGSRASCGAEYGNTYTTCEPLVGSPIYPCGTGCPSGYYATATGSKSLCKVGYGSAYTTCDIILGSPIYPCGTGCPSGYRATFSGPKASCGAAYGNTYTNCVL